MKVETAALSPLTCPESIEIVFDDASVASLSGPKADAPTAMADRVSRLTTTMAANFVLISSGTFDIDRIRIERANRFYTQWPAIVTVAAS